MKQFLSVSWKKNGYFFNFLDTHIQMSWTLNSFRVSKHFIRLSYQHAKKKIISLNHQNISFHKFHSFKKDKLSKWNRNYFIKKRTRKKWHLTLFLIFVIAIRKHLTQWQDFHTWKFTNTILKNLISFGQAYMFEANVVNRQYLIAQINCPASVSYTSRFHAFN